jgi:hypothetical protein
MPSPRMPRPRIRRIHGINVTGAKSGETWVVYANSGHMQPLFALMLRNTPAPHPRIRMKPVETVAISLFGE